MVFKYNEPKFKSLVHYICHKCNESKKLGSIKLNKILYFSDLTSYLLFEKPITGETYIKRQFGPVPSSIVPVISKLKESKDIEINEVPYYGKMKAEYICHTEPELSQFDGTEIHLIDTIIDRILNNYSAMEISDATHDRIWEIANIGEELPYYTIFARETSELNEDDIDWANNKIKIVA